MARPFRDRLREAAAYAGLEYSQSAIARSLGITRQSVDNWMKEGEPRPAMIFRMADAWRVDPRWLATEEGNMVPPPSSGNGLSPQEHVIVRRYRAMPASSRNAMRVLLKLSILVALLSPFSHDAHASHNADSGVFSRQVPELITHCIRWLLHLFTRNKVDQIRLFA